MLKKILLSPWTALLTLILIVGIRALDPSFVESVRLRYFDTLITSKPPVQNNVYTVNIDEAALSKYGQWPFPRDQYAGIVKDLYSRGAGLVVFNVLMAEPDRFKGDKAMEAAMLQYPVILPNVPSDKSKNNPRETGAAILGPEYLDTVIQYPGIIANLPNYEGLAIGTGTVNTLPEIDGVNRRVPLVASVDGTLYPALSLEVLRVVAGDPSFQIKLNELGVEKMRIPQFGPVTTDSLGRVWIDWSQKSHSISLADLPKDFRGAVVIVSPTAAGISNPVPTALGPVHPHELQAAVVGTMFNGVNIQRPDYADFAEIAALLALGLIIIFLSRWTYVGLSTTVVGIAASVGGSYWLFINHNMLTDATATALGLILVALHVYGVKFVSEFLQKQQIKKQFGTYLSPDLVAQLQRQPELLKLGGTEQELSIMFTDVRGFTTISEHYGKDVQGLTSIMNRYMTAMTRAILENRGTLDKYIGDAQMAFWNAPVNNPQHAKDAVRTAFQMLKSLEEFNAEIKAEGVPAFGMGLGINTDTVVVGNMGSDQRFDYTCLGDGVNLASRLEGQSKPYGVKIIIGPKTAEYVREAYQVVELDLLAVKGKTEPAQIFTVLEEFDAADERVHKEFLKAYRTGDWNTAYKLATDMRHSWKGELTQYYEAMRTRIHEFKASPPKNWDGIYRATSK
jgi:adenylate cyclase